MGASAPMRDLVLYWGQHPVLTDTRCLRTNQTSQRDHLFSLPQTKRLGMRGGGESPYPGDRSPLTQSTNRGAPPWEWGNHGCNSGPTTDSFVETHSLCPQPVASVKQTGVSVSVNAQAFLRYGSGTQPEPSAPWPHSPVRGGQGG